LSIHALVLGGQLAVRVFRSRASRSARRRRTGSRTTTSRSSCFS